ncbi:MAG: hypothetical protein ABIZ80_23180 [Bryobacteraceae bacterium]
MLKCAAFIVLALLSASAAEFPEAEISNGVLQAKLYLPDAQRGYYRGTRFDWSGAIASLRYQGHEYFGPWFERHDPKIHDAITGPVEEFRPPKGGLGYDEAKVGDGFIRIGVGIVRKPEEPAYRQFHTYDIIDPGKWRVRKGGDWVEFTQELEGPNGYAYVYRKTVRLLKGKPALVLDHSLRNTGKRTIETAQYNHNFFVIDGQTTGPDSLVRFPFALQATEDLKGLAAVHGNDLSYLRELEKGQSVYTELKGHGTDAKDYDIRMENRKAGAGVRITGDRPLSKVVFWSIRTTFCPEPYIDLRVEPGRETRWRIQYEFYTLK